MLQHPRPSNLSWADIESLFEHYGAEVKERKGSAIRITLNGHKAYFDRPHPGKKANRGAIELALELLRRAGIEEARETE